MSSPRIIDLSYPITDEMLVFPQIERPVMQWLGKVNSEGYNLTRLSMTVHTGTHVDAPAHFLKDGATIDTITLDRLFGTAVMFRYKQPPKSQEIILEDLTGEAFELEKNCIFVMYTGIQEFAETSEYNALFPVPSNELLYYLVRKKIKAYMTDATAVDTVSSQGNGKHLILLKAGIPIVENLMNLHLLPEKKPFLISALPLKLAGREGAPCRAVAVPDINGPGISRRQRGKARGLKR
jgi:kynurenine formamidase